MEQMNNQYSLLSEAVDDLRAKGYTDEIELGEAGLSHCGKRMDPAVFAIDSFHRFEGPSDPGDMSIVYAISSEKLSLKGLLVGAYGAEATKLIHKLVSRLSSHPAKGGTQPVQAAEPGQNMKI